MSKELKKGDIIPFEITYNLKYIKKLGSGGTGDTHLFFDETANKYFAIKKFVPKGNNDPAECFSRFKDEIKILLDVNNPNIVRVYNYYLFPELNTGYIQMEYIEGYSIDKTGEQEGENLNDYFIESINAFHYLETKKILHRDIRPSNFLITSEGTLKIIDFGFGKQVDQENINENSVVLNWPATKNPEEIVLDRRYDFRTEIYFLGHLFKTLTKTTIGFNYSKIVEKMCEFSPSNRFQSFEEIKNQISNSLLSQIDFTFEEKQVYKEFARLLSSSIIVYNEEPTFEKDLKKIILNLERIITINSLEDTIQGVDKLVGCFLNPTRCEFNDSSVIPVEKVKDFYRLDENQRNIVLQNIINRLSSIEINLYGRNYMPF